MPCALGKNGVTLEGREGDGATPAGTYPLRRVMYRGDKVARPVTSLETNPIGPLDGWCDDSNDAAYNRPVRLPYPSSAERLTRKDHLYDTIVVLGHNDAPVVPDLGSASFMHVARPDFGPTLGCIALDPHDLRFVLQHMGRHSTIAIHANRPGDHR
ncbi:MAG: L,D-transpeptidase [Candidatus Phaeomarinobacter sp.]